MSVNLDQIVSADDSFGVWIFRTNEIVNALQDVVSLGDSDLANANGNVVINGYVKAYDGILTDDITPVSGAGQLVNVEGGLKANAQVYFNNGTAGTSTVLNLQNDDTTTWQILTNSDHTALLLRTPGSSAQLRLDDTTNLISATGLTIDPSIITNLNASAIAAGTFSTARIPNLSGTKITTGTIDIARIPSIPTSKITAGTLTGDFTVDNGSLLIDNGDDGSVLLELRDNSAFSASKVMMRINGDGSSNLDVINNNDSGDYELVVGNSMIRFNDATRGIEFLHRNVSDTGGFSDTFANISDAPLKIASDVDGDVEIVANAPIRATATTDFQADVTLTNDAVITGNGTVPIGAVMPFLREYATSGRGNAPEGWLFLNGATVPNGVGEVQGQTADYTELYDLLVTLNMPIDGGGRQLPDMRGHFARGYDPRGTSQTEEIGVQQVDQIEDHTHDVAPAQLLDDGGTGADGPNDSNDAKIYNVTAGVTSGSANAGDETQPKNIAFLYCIKAY